MKDYEPSRNFVSRVMAGVDAHEASSIRRRLLSSRPLRYAVWAAGILMALVNIARTVSMFIYPVFCR